VVDPPDVVEVAPDPPPGTVDDTGTVVVVANAPGGIVAPRTDATVRTSPGNRVGAANEHSGRSAVTAVMNRPQISAGNVPPVTVATPRTFRIDPDGWPGRPAYPVHTAAVSVDDGPVHVEPTNQASR
jgi:hypothetical protein